MMRWNIFAMCLWIIDTQKKLQKSASIKRNSETKNEEKIDTLCLPYMQSLSERVERAVKDDKVSIVFKATIT